MSGVPGSEMNTRMIASAVHAIWVSAEVEKALGFLTVPERLILQLRFGIDAHVHDAAAAGRTLGLTREETERVEAKALRKLRSTGLALAAVRVSRHSSERARQGLNCPFRSGPKFAHAVAAASVW